MDYNDYEFLCKPSCGTEGAAPCDPISATLLFEGVCFVYSMRTALRLLTVASS